MTRLLLNARFLMRPPTGVDRVATELALALIAHQAETGPHPGGAPSGLPDLQEPELQAQVLQALRPGGRIALPQERDPALLARTRACGPGLAGHGWEQIALPLAAARTKARTKARSRSGPADPADPTWLLSLCNIGPLAWRDQVVMMHDAQVFETPQSYAPAFRHWYHALQPRLGRRARLVLTVSEHSRRMLEHFGVVPEGRARIVPNGADHILRQAPDMSTLARHGLRPGGYFLVLGTLAPHKNLALVLRAARARRRQDLPLVIAGGGDAAVFGAAGIAPSDGVRLLGRVSEGALRALYDQARALVLPSLTEGFGLPAAEAMACGCPVIASTGGALPELCHGAALMVDPHDQAGWSAAMDRLAREDDLHQALIGRGRARVRPYTWARAARTLLDHLHAAAQDMAADAGHEGGYEEGHDRGHEGNKERGAPTAPLSPHPSGARPLPGS